MQARITRPSTLMNLGTRCALMRLSSSWTGSVQVKGARSVWTGGRMKVSAMTPNCCRRNGVVYVSAIQNEDKPNMDAGERKSPLVVVSFYKFADLPDYAEMRKPLRELCEAHLVSGGIILAPEGINGSICGTRESLDKVFAVVQSDVRFENLRKTEAPATAEDEDIHHGHSDKSPLGAGDDAPFRWGHVRVKLKNEVVPLGIPGIKPSKKVGKYVKPKDWNSLISDPQTVTIDVRNAYETRIGKFKGAVDPETDAFREFPTWVEKRFGSGVLSSSEENPKIDSTDHDDGQSSHIHGELSDLSSTVQPKRIAMYCTGGIRCEKATSYFIEKGFDEVYHLDGGILKYLEEIPPAESLWEGECFVFDKRVSVEHGLIQGSYGLCYACKKPVNEEDRKSPFWEKGVSCAYCFHCKTEEEKARARARQSQFQLFGVIGGPDQGKRKASPLVHEQQG